MVVVVVVVAATVVVGAAVVVVAPAVVVVGAAVVVAPAVVVVGAVVVVAPAAEPGMDVLYDPEACGPLYALSASHDCSAQLEVQSVAVPRSEIAPNTPSTTAAEDCPVATAKYIVEPEVLITMWFGPVEKTVASLSGSV